MLHIVVKRTLEHNANRIWAVLEDFGNIGWAAGDNRVEVIGSGIGMIRRIFVEGLEPIDEVLEAMDADNKRVAYGIPTGLPFPIEDYHASAQVVPVNSDSAEVIWQSNCRAASGTSDQDAVAMMEATYNQLIDWLDTHLNETA